MSEKNKEKTYPQLRPLTEKHLKNLYKVQLEDNCSKINSEIGKIKCNICGYETELEFLHFGRNKRTNEKCPNCYSLKRTRLLWYYLENKTDFLKKDGAVILHTAPETSIYKKVKENFKDRYISSDIYKTEFVDEIIDIQDIPYNDDTFDVIITSHVLEHVPDDYVALKEFYRVLKPNGKVIILIPSLPNLKKTFEFPQINSPILRQRYYKQHDHRRYYGDDDFYRLLELVGFETIKEDKYFLKNHEDIKLRYSLADDPIFIATKKIDDKKDDLEEVSKNYCSICDSEVTFNTDKSYDLICCECNSTSHERLLFNQSKKFLTKNSKVLYINPKNALETKLKSITNNYYVLPDDNLTKKRGLSGLFSKENQDSKKDIKNQIQKIPDNSFDIIFTNHLLDKEKNDIKLFNELTRILKKDGKLLLKENCDLDLIHKLEDPTIDTPKLKSMFYGNYLANRCYGYDFLDFIKNNGYDIEYEDPENQRDNIKLKDELIKDPIFLCTKK